MNFPIHTVQSAPAQAAPVLSAIQSQLGLVPNLTASMASAPVMLQTFAAARDLAAKTSFTPVEREAIAITVHHNTQCTYGMAVHSTVARKVGMGDADLRALREGELPPTPRLAALSRFACEVTSRRGRIEPAHVEQLCAAGFAPEQALEVLTVVAMAWLASSAHYITRVELDAPFQPQRWPGERANA
ncbi:MAG TPA: carboxymuconolactone decarboxylase family protein [bacterium]